MRILFDLTPYSPGRHTGASRYAVNTLFALSKIDHENEYLIFGFADKVPFQELWPENFKYVQLLPSKWLGPIKNEKARRDFVLNECKKRENHIVHATLEPINVEKKSVKTLFTLHDVMRKDPIYRGMVKLGIRAKIRNYLRYHGAKKSDHIITISDFSKKMIMKYLGIDPSKISVAYLGVEQDYKPGDPDPALLSRMGVEKPFALFVSDLGRQKNEGGMLRAFLKAAENNEVSPDLQLVIVGDKEKLPDNLSRLIETHAHGKRVKLTGYVSEKELIALYQSAMVFAMPSFYEGFGIPALEAMSCGTPVISSKVTSLPEVVGDAAVLIDPYSEEQLRQALVNLCNNEAERIRRKEMGIRQAAKFSFEEHANTTLQIYKQLAKQKA